MAGSKHRNRGISKRRWLAGLVTAFALIIIVIAASSGGGTPSTPTSKNIATPALPRPGAPLQQQLNALDQIVNHAAGQSGS